jgi:asparagine synthase (glutamine-hydrolysing)
VRRPKRGFGLDVAGWLRGPLRGESEALLLRSEGRLQPRFVRTLWERCLAGDAHLVPRVWGLVRLLRWLDDNAVG